MTWIRAIRFGFFQLRGKLFLTAALYLTGLILSTIALRPFSRGFHAALDESPVAREMLTGGGVDLLAELGLNQPGLWVAGFSELLPVLAVYLLLGMFLTAGIYGFAAKGEGPAWRAFVPAATRLFWPFLALFFLNLVAWAAASALFGLGVAGLWSAFRESTDPGVPWRLFLFTVGAAGIWFNLFRNSVGFAQARYAVSGGSEGLGRCFLKALAFTFRRFVPVNGLTWLFNALRGSVAFLCIFVLTPGYETPSARLATALLLQAAFLWAAFLRVAEAGAQVEYQRGFPPPVVERKMAEPARTQPVEPPPPAPEPPEEIPQGEAEPRGPEPVDSVPDGA